MGQVATFTGAIVGNSRITAGVIGTTAGSLVLNSAISGAVTQTTNSTTATTPYSIQWPAAVAATNGAVLTSTTSGVLSWASNPANAWLVGGNMLSSGAQILGVVSGTSTLTIDSAGAAALTFSAAQLATFAGSVTVTGASVITAGVIGTTAGSLILNSATASGGSVTQTVGSMLAAASYSVKWPTAQGGANTVLTNSDGAGTLTWAANPTNAWLVGGNALSSGAQILGVVSGTSTLTIDSAGATALTFGAAQLATFAGSVTVTGASVIAAGVIGTTAGSLVLNSATASGGSVTQTVGSMLAAASYLVKWPTAQGGANTVLTNSDGAGTLTWASNPANAWLVGGNTLSSGAQILGVVSGTSTLTIDSAGAAALTFGAAQLATFAGSVTVTGASVITAGVIGTTAGSLILNSATASGGSVTQTVGSMLAAASYSIKWPTAQGGANTVLTNSDGAGTLIWASAGGTAWLVGGNTLSSGAQILGVVSGTSTLMIDSAGAAALTFGAAQLATFAGSVTVTGASVITAGVIGTTAGSLVLNSATASGGSITQTVGSMLAAASYTIKWPTAQGGINTVLTNSDGAGTLTWTSAGGTAWLVGGNTLSAGAQILGVVSGTSTLTIDSAGATALTFGVAQLATFAGSVTVTGASVITAGVIGTTAGSLCPE